MRPDSFKVRSAVIAALAIASTAGSAFAQDADTAAPIGEVTVTGSRIRVDGMQTPTPVTAISADALQTLAPTTLVEALVAAAAVPQQRYAADAGLRLVRRIGRELRQPARHRREPHADAARRPARDAFHAHAARSTSR